MNPSLRRRTLLGGILAGSAAVAVGSTAVQAAPGKAHPGPGFWHRPTQLGTQDRVFLERGLMHAAWVRSGREDGWYPNAGLWNGSGFTTPQFYKEVLAVSASKKLEYSDEVMRGLDQPTWAIARAPFGDPINPDAQQYPGTGFPDPTEEWMTEKMQANVQNLFTVCFGDEEPYSADRVDFFAKAYAALRERYPWILVHNNQALNQYSDAQLSAYTRTAKPDLLTWDWYVWQKNQFHLGGRPNALFAHLERYRRIALAGHDGTGASPITFGQYTTGFRLQPERPADDTANLTRFKRRLHLSESQLNLVPFTTWAAGGKWLSLFRWELTDDYTDPVSGNTWETDGLFLTDGAQNPYPAYHHYARINHNMRSISPYLTRLRSQSIGRVAGQDATGNALSAMAGIAPWAPGTDVGSGLVGASVKNLGPANGGHPGDIFIGTFRQIPGLSDGENRAVLPDRTNASAFMLVNAMAYALDDYTDPFSQGGSGAELRQRLTVEVAPASVAGRTNAILYRVDPATGGLVEVALVNDGGKLTFAVDLDGGAGELFIWG